MNASASLTNRPGGPNDRAQGTGLGLSLVAAFARLHGGEMTIESRLGEGAAVTVRMPVVLAGPSANGEEGPTGGEIAHLDEDAAHPISGPA